MGALETLGRVMNASTDTLKLKCRTCGHEAVWSRADAFRLYGPGATPYEVRHRSRCTVCRGREVEAWI